MLQVMRSLADRGAVTELIHLQDQVVDLSTVRVEHDLYVLKSTNGLGLSIAGALHAQGAAIVNPYPVSLALRDKVVTSRILQSAGVPTPATYAAQHPEQLRPLLEAGPIVVKPYQGGSGAGIRIVHRADELADVSPVDRIVFAQRFHPPETPDLKIYAIGGKIFGVKKVFPRRTEAEKHGEPFTPTPELREIVRRCGRAFGIDLYGVDIIESEGRPYVVDMSSIPGFKGVPDAPSHLAAYLYAAAQRAARAQPIVVSAAPMEASPERVP